MLRQKNITSSKLRQSFSLIILACVLIIFFVGFDDIRAKVRDNKRKADLSEIARALELYYDKHGVYPEVTDDDWQGWDATYEPPNHKFEFLDNLRQESILLSDPIDPSNSSSYFYRYRKFSSGTYGCSRPFYVLQIANFETAQDNHGIGYCPEFDFASTLSNGYTLMGRE